MKKVAVFSIVAAIMLAWPVWVLADFPLVQTFTIDPDEVAATSATVRVAVNPRNETTTVWFEYDTDTSYAIAMETPTLSPGGLLAAASQVEPGPGGNHQSFRGP